MTINSTRPGIKAKVGIKFPANVTASSPLAVTQTGANYNFTIDTSGFITGGTVWVWQIKLGLLDYGVFGTVETAIPPATSDRVNVIWTGGGRSSVGDSLSNAIKAATSWNDTQMANFYTYCTSVIS